MGQTGRKIKDTYNKYTKSYKSGKPDSNYASYTILGYFISRSVKNVINILPACCRQRNSTKVPINMCRKILPLHE